MHRDIASLVAKELIKKLESFLADKKIVVVLGTWCSDSQELFPRLLKVLNLISFPPNVLTIYGVNKNKTVPENIITKYKITNVPTFIVFNSDGTEQGRIIETVKESVEIDLMRMFL